MSDRDYGLDWVDQDLLFHTIARTLRNPLGLKTVRTDMPDDPFSMLLQSMIADVSMEEVRLFEVRRKLNKRISNAVGVLHQNVLGLAENWTSLGTAGGVLDLRTVEGYVHPRFGKPVVAEVKNRFNTIKASEEPEMWRKIKDAANLSQAQGYLFQITPRHKERVDQMWKVSGLTENPLVRVCDGVTAYELVFGVPDALEQLYFALPHILSDILQELGRTPTQALLEERELWELYNATFGY